MLAEAEGTIPIPFHKIRPVLSAFWKDQSFAFFQFTSKLGLVPKNALTHNNTNSALLLENTNTFTKIELNGFTDFSKKAQI